MVGFSAPNNDANSPGINLATTTTSDTRYTLYELGDNMGPRRTLPIDPAVTTRSQVAPLISVECGFIMHIIILYLNYINNNWNIIKQCS